MANARLRVPTTGRKSVALVKCRTLYNEVKLVPAESLIQRPAVYGIIKHNGKLLVAQAERTRRYVLPGGGIDKGEDIDTALIREVREETGIEIEVGEFLHFHTDFFYYDPMDLAIHGFLFYYACRPLTLELHTPDYPPEEDLLMPLWVDIAQLSAESFQTNGEVTMGLIRG
jgi:8-oxo-dGTP pyrophosphatase MutT (NUDIX family)